MNYRRFLFSLMCTLPALPAMAITSYPAGTVFSGGLTWLKPDSTTRYIGDAQTHCSGLSTSGLSGWRLPTELELTNLYFDKGATFMADAGWNGNWLWTSTPYINWYTVARMSDGVWSYTLDPSNVTCVRTTSVETGTVTSGKLSFTKPDATVRNYSTAEAFCAASTANGVTGWRLPTELELSNLYYERGASYMSAQGWTTGWIWSTTPQGSGHQVVRMTDGVWSYDTSGSQYVSCVREENTLPVATLTSGGLSWFKPSTTLQTWSNANTYCSTSTLNGVTGWRLPTELELSNLYYDRGTSFMTGQGWTMDWIWTSDTYGSGHQVVRMSDGQWSYNTSSSYAVTCVRPAPATTTIDTTVNNAGLTFSKPMPIQRPYHNTSGYCSSATIAGQTGWRLPTVTELTDLYTAQGTALTGQAGWPTDWIWTSDAYNPGYQVVRLLDGTWSYALDENSERHYMTCVKSTAALNSGTVSSGGLVWQTPPTITRPWNNTEPYCAAATLSGQNGWRMPSKAELSALYADKGATYLANAGWTMNWIWSFSPQSTGYQVVRMSDGLGSWASTVDSNRYAAACVRDSAGLPAGSLSSGGLTWVRPTATVRPWTNTASYCSSATIAGQTGWRLPTLSELTALYAAQGSANMTALGWTSNWIWSSTPQSSGYQVARMSDGTSSWATTVDANRYAVACVR